MKTHELTGKALDWAVAKCEGEKYRPDTECDGIGNEYPKHRYSTDWEQAGRIIEREHINTIKVTDGPFRYMWAAAIEPGQQGERHSEFSEHTFYYFLENEVVRGPTLLVAAMRCYVASKLGKQIDVPEGLQ